LRISSLICISVLVCLIFCYSISKNRTDSLCQFLVVLEQTKCYFLVTTYFPFFPPQVLVRNVPPDMDESVSEHIEHFFCVNHPDHYLMHQVCCVVTTTNSVPNMKPVFCWESYTPFNVFWIGLTCLYPRMRKTNIPHNFFFNSNNLTVSQNTSIYNLKNLIQHYYYLSLLLL
jgi:hypothetical protein